MRVHRDTEHCEDHKLCQSFGSTSEHGLEDVEWAATTAAAAAAALLEGLLAVRVIDLLLLRV